MRQMQQIGEEQRQRCERGQRRGAGGRALKKGLPRGCTAHCPCAAAAGTHAASASEALMYTAFVRPEALRGRRSCPAETEPSFLDSSGRDKGEGTRSAAAASRVPYAAFCAVAAALKRRKSCVSGLGR